MKNLICCLNEKESFLRITGHFNDYKNINFGGFIKNINEVHNISQFNTWDYTVIDKNLLWFEEAEMFFKKLSVPIIYFDDDYGAVIKEIKDLIPKEVEVSDDIVQEEAHRPENTTRVKIIKKDKIINKIIYTGIDNKKVLIANFTKCAGSTTVTLCLAHYLSGFNILSSVIEPPIDEPTIFHWMAIKDRLNNEDDLKGNGFYSYPHEISKNNKIKSNSECVFDNIAWIVPDYRNEKIKTWDYAQMLKLVFASNLCPITLIDVGSNLEHASVKEILSSIDIILVIVDPFTTHCVRQNKKLKYILDLKNEGYPIKFVVNKWNSAVDDRDFIRYLTDKPVANIPAIDYSLLYRANYNAKIPNSYKEVSELVDKPLELIASLFIDKKFLKNSSSNGSDISGLIKIKNILKNFINSRKVKR